MVIILLLIAMGVFWALKSGYEGYENTTVRTDLMKANADAVNLLNRGDYEHAFPRLQYVLNNTPSGSPLYASAQHNLGTYWFLAARAAQQRGDLQHAKEYYTNALPLLPDRRDEITQAMQSLDLGLNGPSTQVNAPPAIPGGGGRTYQ